MSLAWQSVPRPRAAGASPLFTFASGGHLSFNSERKVRKNATKTCGFGFPQRAIPCRKLALCFSRNRFSRVPLSVKRTVPPQLSATASLPLPLATVVVSASTAVAGNSPSLQTAPPCFCHCEPARRLAWESVSPFPAPQARTPCHCAPTPDVAVIPSQCSHWRGNPSPLYCCGALRRTYPSRRSCGGWGAI